MLRKALSAARSLGAAGHRVLVADKTRPTPAGFSRYCARSFVYPDPTRDPDAFYGWLAGTLESERCDALLPMDDDVMDVVMRRRDSASRLAAVALPPLSSYETARDKGRTVRLAAEAGVPAPATVYPERPGGLTALAAGLGRPLVIKPRQSSGSRGIRIVDDLRELEKAYAEVHAEYPFPLIQEYIPQGERFDVCLIYNRQGELRGSFVQKELRHFPLHNGPSTAQMSVRRPDLLELAGRLMSRLPWCGVVEIEFMIDPRDGLPKLMEINPRFWNSLELAVLAGADFPGALYEVAVCGDTVPLPAYDAGLRCRSLLPGDLLHFIASGKRWAMDPPLWFTAKQGVHDDIFSLRDPLPAAGLALALLKAAASPKSVRSFFKR